MYKVYIIIYIISCYYLIFNFKNFKYNVISNQFDCSYDIVLVNISVESHKKKILRCINIYRKLPMDCIKLFMVLYFISSINIKRTIIL